MNLSRRDFFKGALATAAVVAVNPSLALSAARGPTTLYVSSAPPAGFSGPVFSSLKTAFDAAVTGDVIRGLPGHVEYLDDDEGIIDLSARPELERITIENFRFVSREEQWLTDGAQYLELRL